ncbi:MAG: hypothetical protein ACP5UV_02965, partial [Thermoplasmata archaeon]
MFLRISRVSRGGRKYEYAMIAERYVEDGKQKTKIIKYLGPVKNEEDMERCRRYLMAMKDQEKADKIAKRDFSILPPLEFGIPYTVINLLKETGILKILRRNAGPYAHLIAFMVIQKMMHHENNFSSHILNQDVFYPWSSVELSENNIYHALQKLEEAIPEMEIEIFRSMHYEKKTINYGLILSNFEGNFSSEAMTFGYSNNKDREIQQIVIGIATCDGFPIHHDVWAGNTVDEKLLDASVSYVRDHFKTGNIVVIPDRTFVRSLSSGFLNRNRYISTAYRYDYPFWKMLIDADFDGNDHN